MYGWRGGADWCFKDRKEMLLTETLSWREVVIMACCFYCLLTATGFHKNRLFAQIQLYSLDLFHTEDPDFLLVETINFGVDYSLIYIVSAVNSNSSLSQLI